MVSELGSQCLCPSQSVEGVLTQPCREAREGHLFCHSVFFFVCLFCSKIIPKGKIQDRREKTLVFQSLRRGILNLGPCWDQIR